jgi:predicted DNA-binding transcriptional regulator AlpA
MSSQSLADSAGRTPLVTGTPLDSVVRFASKKDVARLVGMSVRWVDGEMAKGLPHFKLGPRRCRFNLEEVSAWLCDRYHVSRIGKA